MPLIDTKSGNVLYPIIEEVQDADYKWLEKSPEFSFDWEEEKQYELYKVFLQHNERQILGLMSLIDLSEEYRIHLHLIEVGASNRGVNKIIDNIAGCLIAYACRLAFKRNYFGFVSLQPKTKLINWYQNKYGFRQYGRLLAVEQEVSKHLIQKYLPNEEA